MKKRPFIIPVITEQCSRDTQLAICTGWKVKEQVIIKCKTPIKP